MVESATYLVTTDIAKRSGLIDVRYRVADGRFVLDNKDLERVRFTASEYVSGLAGVEEIPFAQARQLIRENGFVMGMSDSQTLPDDMGEYETPSEEVPEIEGREEEIPNDESVEEEGMNDGKESEEVEDE